MIVLAFGNIWFEAPINLFREVAMRAVLIDGFPRLIFGLGRLLWWYSTHVSSAESPKRSDWQDALDVKACIGLLWQLSMSGLFCPVYCYPVVTLLIYHLSNLNGRIGHGYAIFAKKYSLTVSFSMVMFVDFSSGWQWGNERALVLRYFLFFMHIDFGILPGEISRVVGMQCLSVMAEL